MRGRALALISTPLGSLVEQHRDQIVALVLLDRDDDIDPAQLWVIAQTDIPGAAQQIGTIQL